MNFAKLAFEKFMPLISDPFAVQEIMNSNGYMFSSSNLVQSYDILALHKINNYFTLLLHNSSTNKSMFRMFYLPLSKEKLVYEMYELFATKLTLLCNSSNSCFDISMLQKLSNVLRLRTSWSPAHIAVETNLKDSFNKGSPLMEWLNSHFCDDHMTPIHLSVKLKSCDLVKQLILLGADISKCDDDGNNAIHHSVIADDLNNLKSVCSVANEESVNALNRNGETPVHICCKTNKLEMCEVLLSSGANPSQCGNIALPIHYALKYKSKDISKLLLLKYPDVVHLACQKHGGLPLHWCKTQEDVRLLLEHDTSTNVSSRDGHLPLHVMVFKSRLEAAVTLILGNADVNSQGKYGNTALHLAVTHDYPTLVKMLLLFGADINLQNDFGETAGLIAARSTRPHKEEIVEMFSCLGGILIEPSMEFVDGLVWQNKEKLNGKLKVLCLDGGGIRGLVMTQILMAIERETGKQSKDLFDWIAGTSTGAILAMALCQGKSAVEAQRLYFKLKDQVFVGKRPYAAEPIEKFLKDVFGEDSTMRSLQNGPKLVITACLADRKPVQLKLFRNYSDTDSIDNHDKHRNTFSKKLSKNDLTKLKSAEPSLDQLLWKVARSSGAAPTYFQSMDKFLDGGLIANNPTLDVLTEILRYSKATDHPLPLQLGTVVSVGTSQPKTKLAKSVDVVPLTNPLAIMNSAFAGIELGQMLIDMACESNNYITSRGRAWCESLGGNYYRLNPLVEEEIGLDETSDEKLLSLLWDTQVYLQENKAMVKEIAHMLSGTN